jgi:hypothetical protein
VRALITTIGIAVAGLLHDAGIDRRCGCDKGDELGDSTRWLRHARGKARQWVHGCRMQSANALKTYRIAILDMGGIQIQPTAF